MTDDIQILMGIRKKSFADWQMVIYLESDYIFNYIRISKSTLKNVSKNITVMTTHFCLTLNICFNSFLK